MTRRTFLSRLGVLLALATALPAAAAESPAAPSDGFAPFLAELRAAVAKGDKAKVASFCQFPLHSYEFAAAIAKATAKRPAPGQERPALEPQIEEAAFLRNYAVLLRSPIKQNLLTRKPLRHDGDGPGDTWYSVGMAAGKTWSTWFVLAQVEPGKWRLTGTDNVSN